MIEYIENGNAAMFDGLLFRKDKRTGYYLNKSTQTRLHRYVWEYYNGKIPTGHHIHHIDLNKNNNEIENLRIMSAGEHMKLHGTTWDDERKKRQTIILKEKATPKAAEWHGSSAGIAWHMTQYNANREKLHKRIEMVCIQCGKTYVAEITGSNRFCSNNCKSAYRRKMGVDNETRTCIICGNQYTVNKYSKSKTCSKKCSSAMRYGQ